MSGRHTAGAEQMDYKPKQPILEKITIPTTTSRVIRPRLLEVLHGNLTAFTATIINGRAGTGKTTLTADFAERSGRLVSWYKVDAADSHLPEFIGYLLESLKPNRPSLDSAGLLGLAESVLSDRAESVAESLVFQLSESTADPLLIVIEDLHLVYDEDWVAPFFSRLLPLLPADVHVLITCRSMPPTPLWRLRSKQMLRVLDEEELSFTLEEAIRLCALHGLTEDFAAIGLRQTGGRALAMADFVLTPGRAGRAMADSLLAITPHRLNSITGPTPEFQT